jgi:hypothetical protein
MRLQQLQIQHLQMQMEKMTAKTSPKAPKRSSHHAHWSDDATTTATTTVVRHCKISSRYADNDIMPPVRKPLLGHGASNNNTRAANTSSVRIELEHAAQRPHGANVTATASALIAPYTRQSGINALEVSPFSIKSPGTQCTPDGAYEDSSDDGW